jgi:hypothetical protein
VESQDFPTLIPTPASLKNAIDTGQVNLQVATAAFLAGSKQIPILVPGRPFALPALFAK